MLVLEQIIYTFVLRLKKTVAWAAASGEPKCASCASVGCSMAILDKKIANQAEGFARSAFAREALYTVTADGCRNSL